MSDLDDRDLTVEPGDDASPDPAGPRETGELDDEGLDDDDELDLSDEPDEPQDDPDDDGLDEDDLDEDGYEDEQEFAAIGAADTVERARRKALDGLRKIVPVVDESDVEYIVLDEGSKGGFFGLGKSEARVEARLHAGGEAPAGGEAEPGAPILREFVQRVVDLMDIEATVDATDSGDVVRANVRGSDLGLLIGRHGATIDALQYLAAIVVNGDRHYRRQVVVDAEGYRGRREAALTSLAERTAQKVVRESRAVTLKPMSAAERKVVHLHLKDNPRVETVSEGQEPYRAVVVSPRRRPD